MQCSWLHGPYDNYDNTTMSIREQPAGYIYHQLAAHDHKALISCAFIQVMFTYSQLLISTCIYGKYIYVIGGGHNRTKSKVKVVSCLISLL